MSWLDADGPSEFFTDLNAVALDWNFDRKALSSRSEHLQHVMLPIKVRVDEPPNACAYPGSFVQLEMDDPIVVAVVIGYNVLREHPPAASPATREKLWLTRNIDGVMKFTIPENAA